MCNRDHKVVASFGGMNLVACEDVPEGEFKKLEHVFRVSPKDIGKYTEDDSVTVALDG